MDPAAIGEIAVTVAAGAGLVAAGLGVLGRSVAAKLLHLATAAAGLAVALLLWALVVGRFDWVYVADTTTRATPAWYRVAGLWAATEGSLLLWTWFHLLLGSIWIGRRGGRPGPIAVIGLVAGVEATVVRWLASPFGLLDLPAIDGGGLVAVLRHPSMLIHPPLLYLGLTATVVPFAATVADGFDRSKPVGGGRPVLYRRWLAGAWMALTLGMLLGARWAYVEAGWGGFWAWDAVENTSLLPWLALTGALHAGAGDVGDRWGAAVFPPLAFVSTVFGMVLTRSGATGSVHAFAEDNQVGLALLALAVVVLVLGGYAAIRLGRTPTSAGVDLSEPTAGGRLLRINALVLALAWVAVATGTFGPTIVELAGGTPSTTDPGYYGLVVGPVAIVGLIAMTLALTRSGAVAGSMTGDRSLWPAAGAPMVGVVIGLISGRSPLALAVATTAVFAVVALLLPGRRPSPPEERRPEASTLGLRLTHAGLALLLAAAAGSSLGRSFPVTLTPGDHFEAGGRSYRLDEITTFSAEEYDAVQVRLSTDGEPVVTEIRRYRTQIRPTVEAALRSTMVEDTIIAAQDVAPDRSRARLAVTVRPLVRWVWVAGTVLLLGVVLHLSGWRRTAGRVEAGGPRYPAATAGRRPAGTTSASESR